MHEDYLELYIQFGYILLFMVTYPMAAFWAWVNNVLELRVDAFKLTRTQRRPAVHRVGHIGAWQVIRPLPPPPRFSCYYSPISSLLCLGFLITFVFVGSAGFLGQLLSNCQLLLGLSGRESGWRGWSGWEEGRREREGFYDSCGSL